MVALAAARPPRAAPAAAGLWYNAGMLQRVAGAAVCAALFWSVSVLGAARPAEGPQAQAEYDQAFLSAWAQQPRATLAAPGPPAKIVVVKFNDWMCPGCKYAFEAFKPLLAKYAAIPGALKYLEKDWPWNTACNTGTQQTFRGHEAACDAAAAVRLAADAGKRDAMIDWLFRNQEGMTPDRVKAHVVETLAIGAGAYPAAYARKLLEIRKDVDEGLALHLNATPTYYINGIKAAGGDGGTIPERYFELALKYEFERK